MYQYRYWYGYTEHLPPDIKPLIIQHINYEGKEIQRGIPYYFFRSRNSFRYIPSQTFKLIKHEQPDILLIHGIIFPLQVLALRRICGRKTAIIIFHHMERPERLKRIFQRLADRYVSAYIFTKSDFSKEWLDKNIIKHTAKCYELQEGSTDFKKIPKEQAKIKTGITGRDVFLWVGRLNANKDPICVLTAFQHFAADHPDAKLYMIYQTNDMLEQIQHMIADSRILSGAVTLVGKVDNDDLPYWYSSADFYLSGSHSEGTSAAMLESMACGCIPVVTDIPAFRKLTAEGKYGLLYKAGNSDDLHQKMQTAISLSRQRTSEEVVKHFNEEFSFAPFSARLIKIFREVLQIKKHLHRQK
ncbi:MAG: glycosyltransferase family 4 protein [Taibaiella sp.]|nr:glycosyltransferase family 4 protein [Taibaiella sp.]